MPELVPFAVDRSNVTPYFEALREVLNGDGPALAPYPVHETPPEIPRHPQDAPDDLALVVATSGSTGAPKRAMLTREALVASAVATHERLGGPGTWLLPLPPAHIAGTQVLVRSIIAGTTPIVMEHWSSEMFVKATQLVARNAPPASAIYTSLVPSQLHDVLGDPQALNSARRYRAILVGGAATSVRLRHTAEHEGLRILTTYGSSETAGGCVYDGRPLSRVEVDLVDATAGHPGRVRLSGPMIAAGYLEEPALSEAHFAESDGRRSFLTDDFGEFQDGVLTITGRVDDVIVTNGYKISPHLVEAAIQAVPGVRDAVCLGLPDERRGQVVALAVAGAGITPGSPEQDLLSQAILDVCRAALPPYAVPRRIAMFERLPTRGIGKLDRVAIAAHDDWRSL